MAPDKNTRIDRRRAKTRQHISETAISLFNGKCISAISFDEIAQESDFSRGTLYSHFSNKEELVREILSPVLTKASLMVSELTALPPLEAIDKLILIFLELWKQHKGVMKLIYKVSSHDLGSLNSLHDDFLENILGIFSRAKNIDCLRFTEPELTARLIYKTSIPLLETFEDENCFDEYFLSSMKNLIFKNDIY